MKQASALTSAIAMAMAAFTGTLYAQEPVKVRADYSRPGRQIDDSIVTSHARFDKPGRELDDGSFLSAARAGKTHPKIDDETLHSRKEHGVAGQRRDQSVRKIRKKVIEE